VRIHSPHGLPVLRASFDAGRVGAVRRSVGSALHAAGLGGERADDFLTAVNEVMTNAVRHGGGTGEIRLWRDGALVCEVRDDGDGFDADAYTSRSERPPITPTGGLGLWVASRMSDAMSVTSGPAGTTVQICAALGENGRG
jgi:anti-sigma regulatory factor (Ser/Thr protein kinase)